MSYIKEFLTRKSPQGTVFTIAELAQLVPKYSGFKLRSALKYAVKNGDLVRITRGIYINSTNYSRTELANKYRTPSYVSLYTVLQETGIVFQPYSTIYLVSKRSEKVELDGQKYIYRKIKDEMLLNPLGLVLVNGVQRATAERAICDKLYLDGDEYFDNLRNIDWELMRKLSDEVYTNNKMIKKFIEKNESIDNS